MGLKICKPESRRFRWPVRVQRPEDREHKEYEFTALFTPLSTDELDAWDDDRDVLGRHLVGWEDLSDENDQPLEYSDDAKRLVLNDIDVLQGLARALQEAHSGRGPARKN